MGAITKASQEIQQKKETGGFQALLKHSWPRIAAVMPKQMNPDRMFQLAVSCFNQTPGLAQCSPASVLSCLMKCSALGLEPSAVDGLGRAYILPYNNKKTGRREAQFIIGYKGILDLARRSGQIKDISARAVHAGDEFEYEYGLTEGLRHVPSTEPIEGRPLTHVYVVAHFTDGGHYIDVMSKAEVDAVRKRSKAASNGPWSTDYEAMAKKTVIRRAFPYLPVSVEVQSSVTSDETTPAAYDAEGVQLFADDVEVPDNVDTETGEVYEDVEDASDDKVAAPTPVKGE